MSIRLRHRWMLSVTSLVLSSCIGSSAIGAVLRVDGAAPPGGDGQSWNTALQYLRDAITLAAPGSGVTEIRIAGGTYRPDQSAINPGGSNDRTATLTIPTGVSLRGGFAGLAAGKADPDQQDFIAHPTIINGDLGMPGDRTDNTLVLLTMNAVSGNVFEGLILRDAYNDLCTGQPSCIRRGGGALVTNSSVTFRDCRFEHNAALNNPNTGFGLSEGGGICSEESSLTCERCVFVDNFGNRGAALYIRVGTHNILDCQFLNNQTNGGALCGTVKLDGTTTAGPVTFRRCLFEGNMDTSAIANTPAALGMITFADVTLDRCIFRNNRGGFGGAVYTGSANKVIASSCLFDGNIGGSPSQSVSVIAWFHDFSQTALIINCTFVRNVSMTQQPSPVLRAAGLHDKMVNCIMWGNVNCTSLSTNTTLQVFDSCVQGGYTGTQANVITIDPKLVDLANGDFRLRDDSPCIDLGDTAAIPPGFTLDLADQPRVQGADVDLGALEGGIEMCAADVNNNAVVDIDDLVLVITSWGSSGVGNPADINHDNIVNIDDLVSVITHWGACP